MVNILLRNNPVDPNGCKRTNFNRQTTELCKESSSYAVDTQIRVYENIQISP